MKKRDILSVSDNVDYQTAKLSKIIHSALKNVPYYRDANINVKNLTYDEFCKLPILTKDVIRNSTGKLTNKNYTSRNSIKENSSGGSTGEPVIFYQTKEQGVVGAANYYYALRLNEANIYDKSVDLWGAERDMHNPSLKFNWKSFLLNKTTLNTFILSEKIIKEHIRNLNITKPHFIKAYVHSIYDIAKYINQNNIPVRFTPIIHCTTGPLYPEMREEISIAFNNAYVYNFYGSREVSAIATEVKGQKGMYILYDNVFVEILDEKNQPVKMGEEGEIVITTLNNEYMPLIRYKIGDRAIKGDQLEFGTLVLDNVIGRTLGVIYKNDGKKFDGQFFTTLFFSKQGIKSFQLIQEDYDFLTLKIIKNKNFEESELNQVVERIKKELENVTINIEFVDKIDLTSTGKIMYVYSKMDI